ncbi:MAG: YitT family protein [Oscillospiraceae bacterium]|nr:YitT family protein [Oscillospiraceae bacterium]
MSKKETAKRYILFIISLFISAQGVAITKTGDLGVSPISSVANIMSEKFQILTMGNWLIIWNCVLILGQIIILQKNFKLIQLLQIPVSFLFGYFTDFGMWLLSYFDFSFYPVRIALVVVGTFVLGFGIALAVIANVIMNSGEAFVKAVADVTQKKFGNVKIFFDVFCVVFSIILSLIFFNFSIVGTREGTIIAAFLTGISVKLFSKPLKNPVEKLLAGKN